MTIHSRFLAIDFFSALVVCLTNLLPDSEATVRESHYPTDIEKWALVITAKLLQSLPERSISDLIDAGLIRSWLQHYPFRAEQDFDGNKAEAVRHLIKFEESEYWQRPLIKDILRSLIESNSGGIGLAAAGLWDPKFNAEDEGSTHLRRLSETGEEMALRRRRREAIVMGEEVLQQGEEIHDLDTEQVLNQIRGVSEEQHPSDTGFTNRLQQWLIRGLPLR